MMVKTRYFVIVSLLVVVVGLGTGLVAYYVGFPATAFFNGNGPDELRYMPSSASVVGYVEVREIMASDLRQRVHESMGSKVPENGRKEFQELTGINYETDIERIVVCFDAKGTKDNSGLVFARGLFDAVKIEALMREHGAQVQDYKGKRFIVAKNLGPNDFNHFSSESSPQENPSFALTFMEPGLVAFGGTALVQHAIDLQTGGGSSAATNDDLVAHVRDLQGGNAWVVGRMDVLRERAKLPDIVASQIPPITWFSVRGRVDGGLQAVLTAEARDDESANMLRDVVRGFLALAKLQSSSKPEFQRFVQSIQLGGNGKTVSLALEVPAQVFETLGAFIPKPPAPKQPDAQQ
jgi:hypothetical protein